MSDKGKVALRKELTQAKRLLNEARVLQIQGCGGSDVIQSMTARVEDLKKQLDALEVRDV